MWRISRDGSVDRVLVHEALGGLGVFLPAGVGANGIAYRRGILYLTNTEKGTLLTIPVGPDRSLGMPSVIASGPQLESADGLALDAHGNVYVAVIAQSTIVRVRPGGAIDLIADAADGLDWASSIAFDGQGQAPPPLCRELRDRPAVRQSARSRPGVAYHRRRRPRSAVAVGAPQPPLGLEATDWTEGLRNGVAAPGGEATAQPGRGGGGARGASGGDLAMSVLSLGEMRRGIELVRGAATPTPPRRSTDGSRSSSSGSPAGCSR